MTAEQNSQAQRRDHVQEFRKWLARLPKDELATVIAHRRDTALPIPPDINSLSTRLLLPGSIALAFATCDAAELALIEALSQRGAELAGVSSADVAHLLPFAPDEALETLRNKALVFNPDDRGDYVLLPRVMQALPNNLMLLHQPNLSVEDIRALSVQKRKILTSIARAGGSMVTAGSQSKLADSPDFKELLHEGIIIETSEHTVAIPRTIRQAMQGHVPTIIPLQPTVELRTHDAADYTKADQSGTAAGLEVVYTMDRLIETLARAPQALLKNKSLGIRQVSSLAQEINKDAKETRALLALGFAAQLLGRGEPAGLEGNFLAPTMQAMQWLDSLLDERWQVLLQGWEQMDSAYWNSQRGIDAEVDNPRLPELRKLVVQTFTASTAALSDASFWPLFAFLHPLPTIHSKKDTISHLLQEVRWIGAVAHGQATAVVRESFAETSRLCPEPIEQFIIQADHTAMAPGPLTPEVQRTLSSFATLESPGLASVYRFDHDSVRRGLDSSLTAAEMKDFLRAHTWGDVPQAINVLIDDIARSHGTLRSSAVRCYVRSDDSALLSQAVSAVANLRAIAPTVAVSALPLSTILDALRAAGFSPAAEDESGLSIDVSPEPAVVPATKSAKTIKNSSASDEHVERAVAHLISTAHAAGERSEPDAAVHTPPISAEDFTGILRAAARGSHPVNITYVNKHGEPTTVGATPLRIDGGQVDALVGTNTVRFPLHRISAVVMD